MLYAMEDLFCCEKEHFLMQVGKENRANRNFHRESLKAHEFNIMLILRNLLQTKKSRISDDEIRVANCDSLLVATDLHFGLRKT